ncbi:MAG TPA: hypothetical protein VEH83_08640 [Gemmatimonadales bacterium]|nr:hypothetical protein [Gemmatimonadales bacterium]
MVHQPGTSTALHRVAPLVAAKSLIALAVLGAGLAACRDSTTHGFTVALSVTRVQGPTYGTDAQNYPYLTCGIDLEATPVGSGDATWQDAEIYFYAANDLGKVTDSAGISQASVQESWGNPEIGRNGPQQSGWELTAGVPFAVKVVYRYQVVGGTMESSSVSATCSPTLTPGPAPAFSTIAIDSSTVLQPGGKVAVNFTVTSSVGLWATFLDVSGPCDATLVMGEPMLKSDTRSASVTLPDSCSLGVPVHVAVTAFDAALHSTSMGTTLPGMVDTIPPTAEIMLAPPFGGAYDFPLAGQWFVGDSVRIIFIATDNNVIRSLIWEVEPQGLRDSVVVNATGWINDYLNIPVLQSWAGPIQMRFYARDASGNTSQVVESAAGAMSVIPTVNVPVSSATVSLPFGQMVWDSRRGELYLNQGDFQRIGVFSRGGMTLSGTIDLGDYAGGFDLSSGGDSLFVPLVLTRSLAIVDLRASPPLVTTVPLPGVDSTMDLVTAVAAANGKVLITANNYAAGTGHLYTYAPSTGAVQLRTDAGSGGQTGGGALARSYDHSVVVLNGGDGEFQRYDAATDAFEPAKTARIPGLAAQVDGSGAHVTVGGDIYDSTLQYVLTPSGLHYVYQPIVLSPDGQAIYFSYGNKGNVRVRTSDGTPIDHLQFGMAVNGLSMSPDGSTLAVMQESSQGVYSLGFVSVPPLTAGAPVADRARASLASSADRTASASPGPNGVAGPGRVRWQASTASGAGSAGRPGSAVARLLAPRRARFTPRSRP